MARQEFPKAIKVACIRRATKNDVVYCEECHAIAKRYQVDHINPDGLTGKPTLENAKLLCIPCHKTKTAADVANIAKAKRREAKDLGVKKPTSFQRPEKVAKTLSPLGPPRSLYEDIQQ